MKNKFYNNSTIVRFIALLHILLLFSACHKDKDTEPTNSYLVDYKLVSTLPVSTSVTAVTLLSFQYPEAAPLLSTTKYEVQVYKVTYKTHYKSDEIIASGLICVPNSDEEFPLISFQNGTNTSNNNAPSVNPSNPSFLLLQSFAGNGYIILIPDYIGFGSSSATLHPYYVIEPTNNAVIDLMHAADEFLSKAPVKAKHSDQNYLMGYSQGGWATLCAFKQIETENELISVNAASCGAGAYNLINTAYYIAHQQTFPSPLYLPYYIYSHKQYGTITDPLNIFFNEPYSTRIPGLFDGLHNHGEINSELNDTIRSLLIPEFITSLCNLDIDTGIYHNLEVDLISNSVESWPLQGLLRFYHGNIDDNVPVSESQNIYHDFLILNSPEKVKYFEMEGLSHDTGVIPWGIQTLLWFNTLENKN
jgi:hypothetical protein